MIEDILAAIPLGFVLSFMIGPVFFILLETSITKGFRAALVFNSGVILGDIVFILIAFFSSYRLIQSIKDEPALFIFGGILMFTYGIISFIKVNKSFKLSTDETVAMIKKKDYGNLFLKGFLLNFINIGVLGFWLALLITIGPKLDMNSQRITIFFSTILVSYFIIDIGKILIAKKLRVYLNPNNILKIKKIISIILMVSGLLLTLQSWFPKNQELYDSLNSVETIEK
uniref:LysE family translocator n=1 Tax=Flavobacterium sp. TaxID=239 RepID=UPI0040497BFF